MRFGGAVFLWLFVTFFLTFVYFYYTLIFELKLFILFF
ncbi:hypothetical protein ADIS_4812 [Lunatimonas lonarensis]|uniref:Uncharacterized protein n=1 Tax=Lunatimonas lonarensis TaxID=1232681 RepID=R7ZKS4_9BACT|nr:hypothetical protein ADIS_4812 [Lunatimonas lonarensis]